MGEKLVIDHVSIKDHLSGIYLLGLCLDAPAQISINLPFLAFSLSSFLSIVLNHFVRYEFQSWGRVGITDVLALVLCTFDCRLYR